MAEDQTLAFDIPDEDIPLPTSIGQEVWQTYVNTLGPSAEPNIQLDFIDFDRLDEDAAMVTPDSIDLDLDYQIESEMAETEEAVPVDWQYWLHDENTLPAVNESNAPRLPSGWVDPDTDEVIP